MAGSQKASENGKFLKFSGTYTSKSSKSVYCSDKKLIPRIKMYVRELGDVSHVDVGYMATCLQSTYSDYSRKKKQRFRTWVEKAYLSLRKSNQFAGQLSLSKECDKEEEWLERREKDHFQIRMEEMERLNGNEIEIGSSSSGTEMEDFLWDQQHSLETLNTMNSSITQMYSKSSNCNTEKEDMKTSKLAWKSISGTPKTPPGATPTTHMTNDTTKETFAATPTVNGTKQVTFSVPEVASVKQTSNLSALQGLCEGVTPLISRKSTPKKKKRDRSLSDDSAKGQVNAEDKRHYNIKRRKVKEVASVKDGIRSSLKERSVSEFKVQTSSVSFSDVGGCDATLREIDKLLVHLLHPEIFSWLGVCPPRGFLLHGPPGCGKTLLAHAIAGELDLPFIKLAATEVVSGVSGEPESTLRDLFSMAISNAPCILFVDEIDAICHKRELAKREMESRIVTQLLYCMDDLGQSATGSQVLVIGATSSPDSLDPALRRAGRFDREICIGMPDQPSRESILKVLGRGLCMEPNFSFLSISRQTPGFVGADLVALIREASLCAVSRVLLRNAKVADPDLGEWREQRYMLSVERKTGEDGTYMEDNKTEAILDLAPSSSSTISSNTSSLSSFSRLGCSSLTEELLADVFITAQDFTEALQVIQPSAKREGFATVPDVSWEDVGALKDIREELSLAIMAPVRYPNEFASLGLKSPPGILLAGPPGCGKTLLAKAIANETGINFISVKGPELLNMYVGESERAVRNVFQRARNSSPCVIFFDELDALCPRRSEVAENSASSRVVNQLLTEMDGMTARKQVFIMAATNRPDIIDPAVLRPGRLDKVLYVGLPSAEDRAAILNTITKFGSKPKLGKDVDLSVLASDQNSKGYTGADLHALVREAAITSLRNHMQLRPLSMPSEVDQSECSSSGTESSVCVVEMKHFVSALTKLKPSVSTEDRLFYEKMAKRFTA